MEMDIIKIICYRIKTNLNNKLLNDYINIKYIYIFKLTYLYKFLIKNIFSKSTVP